MPIPILLPILEIAIPAAVQLISSLVDAFKGDPSKEAEIMAIHDSVMNILGPEAAAAVEARLQREEAYKEAGRLVAAAKAAREAVIAPPDNAHPPFPVPAGREHQPAPTPEPAAPPTTPDVPR